jgi:hypothetical protein
MSAELAITITIGILQIVIGVLALFQRGGVMFHARRVVLEGILLFLFFQGFPRIIVMSFLVTLSHHFIFGNKK